MNFVIQSILDEGVFFPIMPDFAKSAFLGFVCIVSPDLMQTSLSASVA